MIYSSGMDKEGRPIVVIIGAHIPEITDHQRLFLYFLKVMDPIVVNDYVLVYVHTNVVSLPGFSWLKKCYSVFKRGYRKNLKQLFLVEPSFWIKSIIGLFQPFISQKFWKKLVYVEKISHMYKFIGPEQFRLPEDILPHKLFQHVSISNCGRLILENQMFGVALEVVMTYPMNMNLDVPVIFSDAIQCISNHGGQVQGIFRLSGSRMRVNEMIELYNQGQRVDLEKEDLHDVTCILKQYLRELPDPLFTLDLYPKWLLSYDSKDWANTLKRMKSLLETLPSLNYNILNRLFHLLHRISNQAEITKMNSTNLAIVWTPNLLKNPTETLQSAISESTITNQIVSYFISYYHHLFEDTDHTPPETNDTFCRKCCSEDLLKGTSNNFVSKVDATTTCIDHINGHAIVTITPTTNSSSIAITNIHSTATTIHTTSSSTSATVAVTTATTTTRLLPQPPTLNTGIHTTDTVTLSSDDEPVMAIPLREPPVIFATTEEPFQ
eukprot:TRINITY_DN9772_c0_g1_i2.p1 TRINITY_DN9772_c0_g1~~TRINITY_DN9772_c0_g1_i2.p1  ORF type:complete len:568 (-),score=123.45 TRINITY_DN9772_c0_g1_i2:74-1555(-)